VANSDIRRRLVGLLRRHQALVNGSSIFSVHLSGRPSTVHLLIPVSGESDEMSLLSRQDFNETCHKCSRALLKRF